MPVKEFAECSEVDQNLTALITNSGAVMAVTEAVQGTLGPKGLDCLLVDQYGGIMVTNDGVTILKTMDVSHPAARILISAAEHQEEQVGDGTTTATIIAGALIAEGVAQITKGVPVVKVIDGIRLGIEQALALLKEIAVPLKTLDDPLIEKIALVAARGRRDLAELVVKAARIVGPERLSAEWFRLANQIIPLEGSENALIQGTVIQKEPLNREMPRSVKDARILIIDDALEPTRVENEALATEAGFNHRLHQEQDLIASIQKLAEIGIKAIFTDRAISDSVGDLLTDMGIIGVQGVAAHEWRRLAEMTGARPVKKGSLLKSPVEILRLTGEAAAVIVEDKFRQIRILGKPDQQYVTILVGAHTKEVVGERERIAKDAAAAVQAAWRGGVVPGGGGAELAIARKLGRYPVKDLSGYGFNCVIEALRRPFIQICVNSGFNPLEKIEQVLDRQERENSDSIGIDCETGLAEDLAKLGIWDPYLVKYYAIRTAGEVGEAILRIQMIIKMKEERECL